MPRGHYDFLLVEILLAQDMNMKEREKSAAVAEDLGIDVTDQDL